MRQPKTKTINLASMWDTLGIDNAPTKKSIKFDFPQVITDKGWVNAREVMKDAGFICDSVVPAGTGFMGTGSVNINQINSLALDNVFLNWGELSLLEQNCVIQNICSIFAQSMTEKWIKFNTKDKNKQEKIKELEEHIKKFKLKDKMNTTVYKTILLGTAYISPKFKNDEEDLTNELILDSSKIQKDSLEDIYIIEPTWVVPIEFNMVAPRKPNFYKPEYYVVFGERIHYTRMQRLMYIEPVNLLSPMYLFGGIPLIQQLLPYVLDFINTKKQIVQIVSRFNTSILKTNLNALHGTDAYAKTNSLAGNTKGRAGAFNAMRNNFGLFMLDKDEEFNQIQINTSGLVDILQQQGEFLSLFTRIPVSKLFGQAPRGMNATGEYDANQFNDLIHSIQEAKLRPILDYCIKILMLDLWGEIDEELHFDFVPLGELNETTQSQLKTEKVNRAVSLVQCGMADPNRMMDVLVKDPDLELDNYDNSQDVDLEDDYEDEE